eukprot:246155_1
MIIERFFKSRRLLYYTSPSLNRLKLIPLTHTSRYKFSNDTKDNTKCNILFPIFGVGMGTLAIGAVLFNSYWKEKLEHEYAPHNSIHNWSGTHNASPHHYFAPKSTSEVEPIVSYCSTNNISLRPMGSGISPNGIAFNDEAILSMRHCNAVLNIDTNTKQITVESGITLSQLIRALKPYGLTVESIPSIQDQQIGGLTQVSAHSTGANIGPCDMQIVSMTVVTPDHGTLVLNANDQDNDLFYYFRVGLGTLGIVTQVTLQCVDRHKLKQSHWVMSVNDLIQQRNELIANYKHVRWLWMPHIDNKVVVIASNELTDDVHLDAIHTAVQSDMFKEKEDEIYCQQPLHELLQAKVSNQSLSHVSFADIRDLLIGRDDGEYILDTEWIKEVNQAEAKYWCNLAELGKDEVDFSENILSFECGGQQWVYEVCFACDRVDNNDVPIEIQFALDVLQKIKENNIPAPIPLEHRFTAPSSSYLSPAYSSNSDDLFSWLGIIFYIPTQSKQKRQWIANEFKEYSRILNQVCDEYGAIGHWAKVETQNLNTKERKELQNRLRKRFGQKLDTFLELRKEYDSKGILLNDVVSDLFSI